jgi:biotin transport system substrate-specific component
VAQRRNTARDLAQIAIFAALIAALGLPGTITIGTSAVPITLQTLGVMLTGGILGARKGFLAVATFLVLTTAGLPLLAGGRGGIGVWAGASAGYLVGFLAGVVVIGLLTARILPRYPLWQGILVNLVGGVLVIYLFGVPWSAVRTGGWGPALSSMLTFLPGDVLKAVVAAVIVKQVHRAIPGLIVPTSAASPPAPPAQRVSN